MISGSKGNRIVNSLIQKGFCRKVELTLGKKGVTKILIPTQSGCETIGVTPRKHLTRGGGPIHDAFAHFVSLHLSEIRQDWEVYTEKNILNKWTDVVIELKEIGELIAVEIALTSVNEESNISENLGVNFSYIIVGCKDEKVLFEVREIASKFDNPNKIGVCLLSELLRCSKLSELFNSQYLQEKRL